MFRAGLGAAAAAAMVAVTLLPQQALSQASIGGQNEAKSGEPKEKPDSSAPDSSKNAPRSASDDLWTRKTLLGNIGPVRPLLERYGVTFGLIETDEILGNPTGGLRQGAIAEGLTDMSLRLDLRRNFDWPGEFFIRAYQIHGRGLTTNYIGSLNAISSVEAARATRLNELWYEHHFDSWDLRLGQQTIGTEFLNPQSARLFVNATFGWPTLASDNLPSGGPSYPLATPAVRVKAEPAKGVAVLFGLFNGDPTGAGIGGSQLADASGTAFRTSDGAFAVGEARWNPDGLDKNGTYTLGGWYNSERFRDLRFDTAGAPRASPFSNGRPQRHSGDYSLYGMIDQPLWADDKAQTALSLFARAMGAPGDRNLVDFYADAGLAYKGPFGRADDLAGIAFAFARIGDAARGFDVDVGHFRGTPYPVRSGEAVLELTYSVQIAPWLQVQPDFQYVFNPGGGVLSPNAPRRRVGDAAVFGVRSTVTF